MLEPACGCSRKAPCPAAAEIWRMKKWQRPLRIHLEYAIARAEVLALRYGRRERQKLGRSMQ